MYAMPHSDCPMRTGHGLAICLSSYASLVHIPGQLETGNVNDGRVYVDQQLPLSWLRVVCLSWLNTPGSSITVSIGSHFNFSFFYQ